MGKIYNLFSTKDVSPTSHSVESANGLLPLVRKFTDEAVDKTESLASKLQYLVEGTSEYKHTAHEYDEVVMKWAERIHRLGGVPKGLWLVDFDTGDGYLCWSYPEEKVDHFHTYEGNFKNRTKLQ